MEKIHGKHLGIVITPASEDPEGRNRVQVWVPQISNTLYKDWNDKEENKSFYNLDSSQSNGLTQEQIKRLREVLPWAEYAAPLMGGGAAFAQNYATGETSTSVAALVEDGQEFEFEQPPDDYEFDPNVPLEPLPEMLPDPNKGQASPPIPLRSEIIEEVNQTPLEPLPE